MNEVTPVAILASELDTVPSADAVAAVERHFGAAGTWASELTKYRFRSDFQADWKEQVGRWLLTAERYGYIGPLVSRVLKMARANGQVLRDGNDKGHAVLHAELAPAMAAHYLIGTGWRFGAWEAEVGGDIDVDLRMVSPSGDEADFQVKGSDVPGQVEGGRVVNGEYDDRVLAAIDHAAAQLPRAGTRATFVLMNAFRNWPLSATMSPLMRHLIGRTLQDGDSVSLPHDRRGRFFEDGWRHVSGVVVLDLLRSVETRYGCCVLLNPRAQVSANETWFPRARVCFWSGRCFEWARGEPDDCTVPAGTTMELG